MCTVMMGSHPVNNTSKCSCSLSFTHQLIIVSVMSEGLRGALLIPFHPGSL